MVRIIYNHWSGFQERLDDNRERSVTQERQLTSRKDWCGHAGLITQATKEPNEQYPQSLPRGGAEERLDGTDSPISARTRNTTSRKLKQTTLTGEELMIRCHCEKVCRSTRGLKQHQSRSRCGSSATLVQCTDSLSGETKENSSQEAPHSVEDHSTLEQPQHQRPVHVNPLR